MTRHTEETAEAERIGHWLAEHDHFAQRLGIRLEQAGPGACRASMPVRAALLNGFGMTHGAATFALADFAFAVASNSRGRQAVGLATTMHYTAPSAEGDTLVAIATEQSLGGGTGVYQVEVRRGDGTVVGLFTGTAYRRREPFFQGKSENEKVVE